MTEQANAAGAQGAAAAAAAATADAQAGGQAGAGAAAQAGAQAAAANTGGAEKWYAGMGLEPAIEQRIHTRGYKSWADLAKAEFNQAELIGRKGVILPGDTDPPERWQQFYKDLGAPEGPDKYTIPTAEGATPSEFEKRWESAMRPAFHKAGLTQRQIDTIIKDGYIPFAQAEIKAQADADAAAQQKGEGEIAALRQELGGKADTFIATAQRAARALLGKDAQFATDLDKLLGSGRFVRLMGTIGEQFFREGSPALNAAATGFAKTPEMAKSDIEKYNAEIAQNPKHPYRNPSDPLHAEAHKKMMDLMAVAYPGVVQDAA